MCLSCQDWLTQVVVSFSFFPNITLDVQQTFCDKYQLYQTRFSQGNGYFKAYLTKALSYLNIGREEREQHIGDTIFLPPQQVQRTKKLLWPLGLKFSRKWTTEYRQVTENEMLRGRYKALPPVKLFSVIETSYGFCLQISRRKGVREIYFLCFQLSHIYFIQ